MNFVDSDNASNINLDKLSALVRKIRSGDENSFKEFFLLTQPGIYKFLFRYLCDKDLSNDLTQETFIKFWEYRESLDPDFSPKSYLYKIARNLALNHITRKRPLENILYIKNSQLKSISNPENEYEKKFFMDDFQSAVNDLPERCRVTFILCKYDGFGYQEIAEIMNVSLQTVKNQMNKAIAILRKRLSSHLP